MKTPRLKHNRRGKAASPHRVRRPTNRRWNVGRIIMTSIVEHDDARSDHLVQDTVPGATKPIVARTANAHPHHANADNTLAASVQATAYECPNGDILIVDACIGDDKDITTKGLDAYHQDRTEQFRKSLEAAGYARSQEEADAYALANPDKPALKLVKHILLSHLHFDHVGAATKKNANGEWVVAFDGVFHLSRAELNAWEHIIKTSTNVAKDFPHIAVMMEQTIRPILALGKKRCKFIEDGDNYDGLPEGITTMRAPGHTPDHLIVIAEDGDEVNVNFGDALHTMVQVGRPRLKTTGNTSFDDSVKTRRKIQAYIRKRQLEGKKVSVTAPHFRWPVGRLKFTRRPNRSLKVTYHDMRARKVNPPH